MGALSSTYFNTSRYEEVAIYKWDNPFLVVGVYAVFLFIVMKADKILARAGRCMGIISAATAGFERI